MVQHIGQLVNRNQQSKASSASDVWSDIAQSVEGMDFATYLDLMTNLWEAMGRKDPPGNTLLKMWYITLRSMTPDDLGRAILAYLEHHSDEYITPKLLLKLAGKVTDGDAMGIAAWDEVLREIKRVGAYQTPIFSDSRTAATIRNMGGWVMLCDTSPDELHKWSSQRFAKTFAAMPSTADARLTNLIEAENARSGMVDAAEVVRLRISEGRRLRIAEK